MVGSNWQNQDIEQLAQVIVNAIGGGSDPSQIEIANVLVKLTNAESPYRIPEPIFYSIENTGATSIDLNGFEILAGDPIYTMPNACNVVFEETIIEIPHGGTCTLIYQRKRNL